MEDVGVEASQLAVQARDAVLGTEVIKKLRDSFRTLSDETRNTLRGAKDKLEEWAKLQVERSIRRLLQRCPPLIKQRLLDRHMCDCVRDLVCDAVDDIWPEVEEEVVYELRYKIDYLEKYDVKNKESCQCCCLCRHLKTFRNWYLYVTQPVDKSLWQKVRWFSFWILLIIKMFPFYGVSPVMLLLEFIMIDRSDEFQLTQFVVNFKKYHFLTFGVVRGIIGFIFYYSCISRGNVSDTAEYFGLSRDLIV